MTDYSQQKVPDLKKLLQDRSLPISGNKADLIKRLEEDDNKKSGTGVATAGEDEIDWDEDDNKATTAPAAAAIAAGGQGQVANPTSVPNQVVDIEPSKTDDLTVTGEEDVPKAVNEAGATPAIAETVAPEAPKQDFSRGLEATDAEREAEKRTARAKKFGIVEDDEAKKLSERAKKFGTESDANSEIVKGLDSALPERPERRQKRGREDRQGGRAAKRQTPDRRTQAPKEKTGPAKKSAPRVMDDHIEKAKFEARAAKFATNSA